MLKWTSNWMFDHAPKQRCLILQNRLSQLFCFQPNKKLFWPILDDKDPAFVKWALKALKNWKAEGEFGPINAMCGDKDRLFKPYVVCEVPNIGGHLWW